MLAIPKSYLGDGVYADLDEWGNIILTTSNGVAVTNTIVLEPAVLAALLAWLDRIRKATPRTSPEGA